MVFQYSLNQIYQPESLTFNALLAMYFSRSSHLPDLPALLTFLFYSFRPSPLPFLTQLSFEAFIKSPFSFHTPCEQVCDCSVKSLRGKGPTEQKALPNRWRYCLRGQMVAFWPLWRNRCRRANGVQMNQCLSLCWVVWVGAHMPLCVSMCSCRCWGVSGGLWVSSCPLRHLAALFGPKQLPQQGLSSSPQCLALWALFYNPLSSSIQILIT